MQDSPSGAARRPPHPCGVTAEGVIGRTPRCLGHRPWVTHGKALAHRCFGQSFSWSTKTADAGHHHTAGGTNSWQTARRTWLWRALAPWSPRFGGRVTSGPEGRGTPGAKLVKTPGRGWRGLSQPPSPPGWPFPATLLHLQARLPILLAATSLPAQRGRRGPSG